MVAVDVHTGSAHARVGDGAEVTSTTGKIDIIAATSVRPKISAANIITSNETRLQADPTENTKKTAIGTATTISVFTNTAEASIGNNARVDANQSLLVSSQTLMPWQQDYVDVSKLESLGRSETWTGTRWLTALLGLDPGAKISNGFGLQKGFFTTWSQSSAQVSHNAVSIATNWMVVVNNSTAVIGEKRPDQPEYSPFRVSGRNCRGGK